MTVLTESRTARAPLAFALALMLAFTAACGSDSDDSAVSDDTANEAATDEDSGGGGGEPVAEVDDAEFVAAFSASCTATGDEVDSLPDPETYDDIVELAEQSQTIVADGLAELRAITPPAAMADDIAAALDLFATQGEIFASMAEAAKAQDDAAMSPIVARATESRAEIKALLDPLGIDCGFS